MLRRALLNVSRQGLVGRGFGSTAGKWHAELDKGTNQKLKRTNFLVGRRLNRKEITFLLGRKTWLRC